MKKHLTLLASLALVPLSTQATLIAYWNFDAGTPSEAIVDQEINANYGINSSSATISTSGITGTTNFNNHSNDAGGVGDTWNRIDTYTGTTNRQLAISGGTSTTPDGAHSSNGSYLDINFSTIGFENIEITFGQRGQGNGTNGSARSGYWQWSADGIDFFDIGGSYTDSSANPTYNHYAASTIQLATGNNWRGHLIELPEEANEASSITLRLVLNFTNGNTTAPIRIDNIQINGTQIPEPSTLILGSLTLLAFLRRRR